MFCPNCGANVPENSKFCPKCGAKIIRYGDRDQAAGTVTAGNPAAGRRKLSGRTIGIIVAAAVVVIAVIIIIIATSGKKSYSVSWYFDEDYMAMKISYDSSDRMKGMTMYLSDGDIYGTIERSSDSDKNTARYTMYTDDYLSNTSWIERYEYSGGKMTSMTMYDTLNNVILTAQYEYDSSGKLQSVYYYEASGEFDGRIEYTYDEHGKVLTETNYVSYARSSDTTRSEYSYNGGKIQSVTLYWEGEIYAVGLYNYD